MLLLGCRCGTASVMVLLCLLLLHVQLILLSFLVAHAGSDDQWASYVDNVIVREMKNQRLPSVAAAIVKDGKIVYMTCKGWANIQEKIPCTPKTNYLIASVSKTVTATAVMQLVEEGKINLDVDINSYLPFQVRNPFYPDSRLTVRQLLTHTASIRDNYDFMDKYYQNNRDPSISLGSCVKGYFSKGGYDYSKGNFYRYRPGSKAEYSNMGFALLGYIVETVSKASFESYSQKNIFTPLCMKNTSWLLSPFQKDMRSVAVPYRYSSSSGRFVPYKHYTFADYPDGGLRTSVQHMANFLIMYLNGGTFVGSNDTKSTVLRTSTVRQMLTVQQPSVDAYQGLCWYKEKFRPNNSAGLFWSHNGGESGVSTDVALYPSRNAAVIAFSNGEDSLNRIVDALLTAASAMSSANYGISPDLSC